MGRKIPAKKHRGVKDPLEQQAKRMKSLQGKINAPPTDPDEQPVPRSLTELFAFQDRKQNTKKKKVRHTVNLKGGSEPVGRNPVDKLRLLPGESQRAFSLRINSAMRTLSQPDNYDFMDDTESEDVKGSAMAAWQERRDRRATRRLKEAARAAHAAGAAPAAARAAARDAARPHKLTRGQKLTLRNKAKKQKATEAAAASDAPRYERVEFGDVAAAPPALPAPRRAARAKARRGLLLHAMLGGGAGRGAGGGAGGGAGSGAGGGAGRGAGGGAETEAERARLQAVAAYRALKAGAAAVPRAPLR